MTVSLIVLAKAPRPGSSKTRLCPPLDAWEAAAVAEACLRDTLHAVARTPGVRPVLVLEGPAGAWLRHPIPVLAQRGAGLEERIAAAFSDVGGPALLIGMDTPQVDPLLLAGAANRLLRPDVDAVLGPAEDGGWWCVGLRVADPAVFLGIPMSTEATGARQLDRLDALRLRTDLLPVLRDVDEIEDALDVARRIPGSHLSRALSRLGALQSAAVR